MTLPSDAMAAAFPPAFARFGRTLCLRQPGETPCPALFAPDALAQAAQCHAATLAPAFVPARPQHQAALSMWSQYYLLALVPAAVAGVLAAGCELPVAAEGMGAVLAPTGLPECLCLPHGGRPTTTACPVARLTPLLRDHLHPLAEALAGAGLSRRVFWSNTVHVLLWSLRVVSAPGATCAVAAALTRPDWEDGGPNPLAPVLAADGQSRGVCCLRFRLPGFAPCSACPRPPAPAKDIPPC